MKGSVIIPTFRRPISTVDETLKSLIDLGSELEKNVFEIFLIDQNETPLEISDQIINHLKGLSVEFNHLKLRPASVTKAKNLAMTKATGDIFYFFDDDVEVQKGCLDGYRKFFDGHPDAGFLGGREILSYGESVDDRRVNKLKKLLFALLKPFMDKRYFSQKGLPVGMIFHSFFFCNFDQPGSTQDVIIDTARGCNWALRSSAWNRSEPFFDINYSGTSLREETDAYLNLKRQGWQGYYNASSVAFHKRQVGGCENLAKSLEIYESKLRNEAYFQEKYFSNEPKILFFVRTLSHLSRLPIMAWPKAAFLSGKIALSIASRHAS